MKKRSKYLLAVGITVIAIVLIGLITFVLLQTTADEPPAGVSTEGYTFSIDGVTLYASSGNSSNAIFTGDMIGSILSVAIAPNKVYVLCDDILYSMNADGTNRYKIASKCYNPGELAFAIIDQDTAELHTLGYYGGYVYFIEYGTTSKLLRFESGGHSVEELAKNKVSAFTISPDGVLTGYSNADNLGNRGKTIEINLK